MIPLPFLIPVPPHLLSQSLLPSKVSFFVGQLYGFVPLFPSYNPDLGRLSDTLSFFLFLSDCADVIRRNLPGSLYGPPFLLLMSERSFTWRTGLCAFLPNVQISFSRLDTPLLFGTSPLFPSVV